MGFALGFFGTYMVGPAGAGRGGVSARASVLGTAQPKSFDFQKSIASRAPERSGFRLASLETVAVSGSAVEEPDLSASARRSASFVERFLDDQDSASFDERFGNGAVRSGSATAGAEETQERADNVPPDLGGRAIAIPAVGRSASKLAAVASSPSASAAKKRIHTADLSKEWTSPPDPDSHTAIYDVVGHTVYLPSGRRLEAHSGLGSHLDDPRYFSAKGQGPTPPNVYDLTLREELFHGVRAIRLNPVDDGKMFGRDGILAHTYMLGPNGQSNGCVSFSDYQAFLNAFLSGEVNRIVVVEHLANAPAGDTASGWVPDFIKNLFGRS